MAVSSKQRFKLKRMARPPDNGWSVKLLNRTTRSITLTDAGEQYCDSCRIIAEQTQSANQKTETLKNEPEGLLKITCPVNVVLQLHFSALVVALHINRLLPLGVKNSLPWVS